VRIATWNVNSVKQRLPRLLPWLDERAPDVACLQETKVEGAAFPEAELREAGYASVHHSAGRWAGVAILTREGLAAEEPSYGLPGEALQDEARWVEATVGGLRIASVYVPNGRSVGSEPYAQKLQFLEAMAQRAPGVDAILGDFNVCPADLDVYDPAAFAGETHVTAPERERFAALLDAGTVDAFRAVHPDEPGFTWWDYRAGHFHKKMGLRIDAVLLSPGLASRLAECGIDRNFRKGPKPSDHAPLLAELR
jgi:exodeoxyribonuclease-3